MDKKQKKKIEPPPIKTELGLNFDDYEFRSQRPLRKGEGRMLIVPKNSLSKEAIGDKRKPIKIRAVRFEGNTLIVNNGEGILPLNNGKDSDGTKIAKVVKALWEKRYEIKGNANANRRAELMSMDNLIRLTKAPSEGAVSKQIARFNKRTAEKLLPMKIQKVGRRCKLVIKLG